MSILQDKPLLVVGGVAAVGAGLLLWATRRSGRVLTITVPATTANLACGFDAFGAAFELRMTLRAEPAPKGASSTRFEYTGEGCEGVCTDEGNLIWKSALACVKMHAPDRVLPKLVIKVKNDVPFGRGLGSSATAIIAGTSRIWPPPEQYLRMSNFSSIQTIFNHTSGSLGMHGGYTFRGFRRTSVECSARLVGRKNIAMPNFGVHLSPVPKRFLKHSRTCRCDACGPGSWTEAEQGEDDRRRFADGESPRQHLTGTIWGCCQ